MATDVEIAVRKIASVNPATGEVLREWECAGAGDMQAAVARARTAQADWNAVGVEKRVQILRRFQQLVHEKKSDIARLISQEEGKPYVEALLTEVQVVLDAVRFCADNAYGFLREEKVPHGNLAMKTKAGRLRREPYGVIGIISPWNYPFSIPATESLAALVTGNAVVL
jgi:acyl-CoA reductase-like NAD-dependent aldehyde dehydrogenase